MLVIRQEQIETLTMGSEEEFVEFLVKHFKEEDPKLEETYGDENLREMVRGGIKRAKSHDFSTAEDLAVFVSIMFEVAPNFDEQTEIKAVLDDQNTPPDGRFENLWTPIVSEEAWEEAKENYNKNAWSLKNSVEKV